MRICAMALTALFVSTAALAEEVALSYDDGPHPVYTRTLLKVARLAGVKMTLCMVGRNVEKYPDIVREAVADGHELCNHSWSHVTLRPGNVKQEIEKTDEAIRKITGTVPRILRAPYGNTKHVGECYKGRPFVNWQVDTKDWRYRNTARIIKVAVRANAGIILMHDIRLTTVMAFPAIVLALKAQGVSFVTVSQLAGNPCGTLTQAQK